MIERGPIRFEIVKHFGVLSTAQTGWTKEFNIVRWNDREKFDIRDWAPGHERMSKGITLYEHEMKKIFELCSDIFGSQPQEEQPQEEQPQEEQPQEEQSREEQPQEEQLQVCGEQPVADKVAEEELPF